MQNYLIDYMREFIDKGFEIYICGDVVKNIFVLKNNIADYSNFFKDIRHTFISDAPDEVFSEINRKYFNDDSILRYENVNIINIKELDINKFKGRDGKIFDTIALDINGNIYGLTEDTSELIQC